MYKGYNITPRTFELRGSHRWSVDVLIARNQGLRSFSSPLTYPTELTATAGCLDLGRRIIDGAVNDFSVSDLC